MKLSRDGSLTNQMSQIFCLQISPLSLMVGMVPHLKVRRSLVPKRYKSIFVYSRKMQSKFEIYWEMHYKNFRFWLIKSRWFEQLGYNLADL
jgi:hypothetical protein